MNVANFSLILKVNDLDACRIFYRDLLGLGEPLLDSTFAVVFPLGESLTLALQKSAAEYLEHSSSAASFAFATPNLEELARQLEDNGWPLNPVPIRIGIVEYRRGTDPEGNPFFVCQA